MIILIIGVIAGYFFYHDYVQGTVTLSITDPPGGSQGSNPHYNSTIQHIYVLFMGIDIHQSGIGSTNATGWHPIVGAPAKVDMLSVLSSSKSLASVNLPTGTYDQLRFPVVTVNVTFSRIGNVTYLVPSDALTVSITGGGFQSAPGTKIQLLLTISFNDAEILAMNGYLTPHATATVS